MVYLLYLDISGKYGYMLSSHMFSNEAAVQQMDVWQRQPRFPFPAFHHLHAHGCAIYTCFLRAVFHAPPPAQAFTSRVQPSATIQ